MLINSHDEIEEHEVAPLLSWFGDQFSALSHLVILLLIFWYKQLIRIQESKSIVQMLQTDWILTDTWVPLNGFQDQVLKKFPLYIQELRKDHFYPMLRFVSIGSRRFLLLGSLLPLICSRRVRSTYGPHSGGSEPFRLPSAAPLQLRSIFPQCDDQNCIAWPKSWFRGTCHSSRTAPTGLPSVSLSLLPEKPGDLLQQTLIRASSRCSVFQMT